MSEEKTQGTGTTTMDSPGENTVEVTFLPEGKTVTFEHGKLPYKDHGKEESLLDVALNFGIHLDHACGGNCACTTCHVWVKEGRRSSAKFAPRMPDCDYETGKNCGGNSGVESELCFGRALERRAVSSQLSALSKGLVETDCEKIIRSDASCRKN